MAAGLLGSHLQVNMGVEGGVGSSGSLDVAGRCCPNGGTRRPVELINSATSCMRDTSSSGSLSGQVEVLVGLIGCGDGPGARRIK